MVVSLDIVIVGAGLSGLSAAIQCTLSGHSVIVLESTKELSEVGAGLQLTPNSTRLLQRWGVYDHIREKVCEPITMTVHSYKGQVLAHEENFAANMQRKYDAPFADCHRVDLQEAFVRTARKLGIKVVLNAKVAKLDFGAGPGSKAMTFTEAGHNYEADLIIAADGIWSTCRSIMLGRKDPPLPTGDLAYRIVLQRSEIKDPEILKLLKPAACRFWIGPDAHVAAYSTRDGEMFNAGLLVPDDMEEGVARTAGSLDEAKKLMENWDPILTRLISCVDKVDKWKLMHKEEMESWINDESNLVLIGDSCHPMLPYLAQGANSSIEDGAVLGLLLAPKHFTAKSQLPDTLQTFQSLRKARGERIAKEAFKQRQAFHMRDGQEQEIRDQYMLDRLGSEIKDAFPSRWTCPVFQPWLYGYDAMEEVRAVMQGSKQA